MSELWAVKKLTLWENSNGTPPDLKGKHPFTSYSGFTPGTPIFTHYTSARWRYAPNDIGSNKQQ